MAADRAAAQSATSESSPIVTIRSSPLIVSVTVSAVAHVLANVTVVSCVTFKALPSHLFVAMVVRRYLN